MNPHMIREEIETVLAERNEQLSEECIDHLASERNGNLTSDNAEEMDCFEFTEEGKMLDEMIEQSKEILAKIKDRE